MKKSLLSVALILAASAANAQLLNYGFEGDQTLPGEIQYVNWDAYPTATYTVTNPDAFEGQNALQVVTEQTANRWERVVAFKGIDIKPEKSYRVSYYVKGTTPLDLAIMQGDFDRDMPLLAGNGESYTQQVYNLKAETDGWQRVSQVFWSPAFETQAKFFPQFKADTELTADYFLRFSFTGAGELKVDNIVVEESSIAGVIYNGDALRVDFGYATNGKELAAAAGGTLILDGSCVKVSQNGDEVEVESVEIKADGNLYIFLPEGYWFTDEDKVEVSFTNNLGLTYSTTTAPESWTNPNCAVYSFESEAAYYDEEFAASSVAYEEAELVSSDPADESFELPYDIATFSFTYNKNVVTDYEGEKPVAVIAGGNFSEELVLVDNAEACPTLTFNRASAEPLAKGIYTITVSGVRNEKGVEKGTDDIITIEVGKVTVAETTYTLVTEATFPEAAANGIPEGWTVVSDGEVRTSENTYGSGGRVFDCAAPQKKGIYTRANGGEGSVLSPLYAFPAGDIEVRPFICGWSNNSNVTVQLLNANDEVVYEDSYDTEIAAEGSRNNGDFKFGYKALRMKHDGSELKMFIKLNTEGFNGIFVGGFEVYTYVETEGEKSEAEVLLAETWSTTNDNAAPAAGSGWRIYAGGVAKNPGQDYNYNGARIFNLGYKNLTKAFYNGMGGNAASDYIIYGEGEPWTDAEGNVTEEPVFKLQSGKIQITYYCTNWKTDLQHQTFDIINKETGEVVYTRTDDIIPNAKGDRNANIEAQKVQFTFYVPETAEYLLKYYTDGEGFVGNIKIETVGSLAVQYKNLLKDAIMAAQEELDLALTDDNYAGATRDALAQAIQDYTEPDFHTVAEYLNAIDHLAQLQKAMQARRANINDYASALENVIAAVEKAAGTKFEGLDSYVAAAALVDKYASVEAKNLDDAELAQCVAEIKLNGTLLNNMINDIVPNLLTKQIAQLAAQIIALDADTTQTGIIAAGDAISDDQVLVKGLKLQLTGKIYEKLGAGEDLFSIYDAEYDISTPDSLELALVQNPMFYNTVIANGTDYTSHEDSYPGWDITCQSLGIMAQYGWAAYSGSTSHPYTDGSVFTAWGNTNGEGNPTVFVSQTLTEMPVGVYTLALDLSDGSKVTQREDGSWKSDVTATEFFYETATASDTCIMDNTNTGQWRGFTKNYKMGVEINPGENGLTGSVTYGAILKPIEDFAGCDNAVVYMTGKKAGFNYAEAAKKVLDEAAEGIEIVERNDEPASSLFFDLRGRQISAAQGVCVRIDRYADGYTVVRKVVVK